MFRVLAAIGGFKLGHLAGFKIGRMIGLGIGFILFWTIELAKLMYFEFEAAVVTLIIAARCRLG